MYTKIHTANEPIHDLVSIKRALIYFFQFNYASIYAYLIVVNRRN